MKKPVYAIKNFLIQKGIAVCNYIFGKTRNSFSPNEPRILLVSTTALGDSLWATPFIEALKKKYPSSYLAILTSSIGHEVFNNNPFINEIFSFKRSLLFAFFSLFYQLRKRKIQMVISLHSSQRLALPLCSIIGAEKIIATEGKNKGLDILLTDKIMDRRHHELFRRKDLFSHLHLSDFSLKTSFYPTKNAFFFIQPFLPDRPFIIFHPGAKDGYKQWPAFSYIQLGKLIQQSYGLPLYITGTKNEAPLAKKIAENIPSAQSVAGFFTIDQLSVFFQKSALVITNDTGPMHLSVSVKTKTIAIFCPTLPDLSAPIDKELIHIFAHPPSCSPCKKRSCRFPFCFYQISPYDVFGKVKEIICPILK